MSQKIFTAILIAVLVMCLMPIAYAEYAVDVGAQVSLVYAGRNTAGNILPRFTENPGSGVALLVKHPADIPNGGLTAGISGVYTHRSLWDSSNLNQDSTTGYTSAFIAVDRNFGMVHLSAQQRYLHVNVSNKQDFFQDDAYETLLKAEFIVSQQKPYVFIGLITPAYVPIREAIGMGGIGITTHTAIHRYVAIHTDSSIATTLLNFNREQETVAKVEFALETEPSNLTRIRAGFNMYQDIRRKEYYTWWDLTASYTF